MNCTTYRTELENIVFKLINTHPSSMSRQKKIWRILAADTRKHNFTDTAQAVQKITVLENATSTIPKSSVRHSEAFSRSIQHASFEWGLRQHCKPGFCLNRETFLSSYEFSKSLRCDNTVHSASSATSCEDGGVRRGARVTSLVYRTLTHYTHLQLSE